MPPGRGAFKPLIAAGDACLKVDFGHGRSFPALNGWRLVLLAPAAAVLSACTGPDYVTERPVDNRIPPLKAGVYSVQAVDVRPVVTRQVEPDYPRELGSILTGSALVVFTVRADGKVSDASVVRADDVLFGEAAVAAISKWRFHPAELKGAAVDCRLTLPFVFDSPYGYDSGGIAPTPLNGGSPDAPPKTTIESH